MKNSRHEEGLTLYRQLMRSLILVFVFALTGLFAGHWQSTRNYVERQLASHAQDAASSLALAMTASLKTGDMTLAETTVMPIFDRGYYSSIVIKSQNDVTLFEKQLKKTDTDSVPDWFRMIAAINPPLQRAEVSSGWQHIGYVEVISEPHFAYEQLWQSSLNMIAWMIAVFIITGFFLRIWLHNLLKPLEQLERAAENLAERHFIKVNCVSGSIELQRLMAGFNRVVDAVQTLLAVEENRAERFRKEAQFDPATDMLNRRGLILKVAEEGFEYSWFGQIECTDITEINRTSGYTAGNSLIKQMAEKIKEAFPFAVWARLNAAGFAVLIKEEIDILKLKENCRELLHSIVEICPSIHLSSGWIECRGSDINKLIAASDIVLNRARQKKETINLIFQTSSEMNKDDIWTAEEWHEQIKQAIYKKKLSLYTQPALTIDPERNNRIHHREILAVITSEDGTEFPASKWIHIASRNGLMAALDRTVFSIMKTCTLYVPDLVAVNISSETWHSKTFEDGLTALRTDLLQWSSIRFELREEDVVSDLPKAADFAMAARRSGFGIAIDGFGVHPGGIASLKELLPDYVKLAPTLVSRVDTYAGRFYLESLVTIANTLDIQVLALSFEEAELFKELGSLGIKGVQGHAVGVRELIKSCGEK